MCSKASWKIWIGSRGVAMLTLCHFYENGLASQVVAIPEDYAITKYFKLNPDAYNLADDEIREIARSGGGIGLIFMNYWLDRTHPANGLSALWQTLEHIHNATNSWDHIMIGTDFDGFTDPPDDVTDSSQMGNFTKMLLDHGLDETAILKILGGNAQRILEKGWH